MQAGGFWAGWLNNKRGNKVSGKTANIKGGRLKTMSKKEIAEMLKRVLTEIVEAAEKSDDPETLARLGIAAERLGNILTFHYSD